MKNQKQNDPDDDDDKQEEQKPDAKPAEGVTVDLDKGKKAEPTPEEQSKAADEKERKRVEYLARQFEKGLKKIDELAQAMRSQPQPQQQPPANQPSKDELDELAERDWKLGVAAVTERVLGEREKKQRAEAEQRARLERLEKSKQQVLQDYPDIDDESSDVAKLYNEALNEMTNEDASILRNEYGPVLVKARMEAKMRQMGITPPSYRQAVKQEVDQEIQRRQRIGVGSIPAGRGQGSDNVVVLTAEQKQLCDEQGIPYEQYAKYARLSRRDFKEGVSVQ